MFEEEELMPYEVKPIINETILSLNDATQCDADEDVLTSYIASLKVNGGSIITNKSFNAADVYKLIKDCCVVQVKPLGITLVQKESYEVAISQKKKCVKI